jgi:hypothetical protein
MGTYIETTVERYRSFDITSGVPFRELVGCLLWIVLNILGPELLRVKDLAKRSNDYTPKGKGKGKGAPTVKVNTSQGKGNFFQKGASHYKGKGSSKGKSYKGSPKGNRTPSGSTTTTGLVCDFCHMHDHISQNCRKRQALHNSVSYQQARSQFDTRQQLLIDQLCRE